MNTVIVQAGQTLLDIAIQELGTTTRLYELATINNLVPSSQVAAGDLLQVPIVNLVDEKNTLPFRINKPSSQCIGEDHASNVGIGFWKIEVDFIIS